MKQINKLKNFYKEKVFILTTPDKKPLGLIDPFLLDNRLDYIEASNQIEKSNGYYKMALVLGYTGHFCIDLDNCIDRSENLSPTAIEIIRQFPGAYTEVSSSGTGIHIIGRGEVTHERCRNDDLKVEFYTQKRYIILTGDKAKGDIDKDCSHSLIDFVRKYLPTNGPVADYAWSHTPVDTWKGPEDDEKLLTMALSSQSQNPKKARFSDLYYGDASALCEFFPPASTHDDFDRSRADAALIQHLCFWTGNNCERIHRLMLSSGLRREKWNREDYLRRSILKGCSLQTEYLRVEINPLIDSCQALFRQRNEETFLNAQQQLTLFADCVYVLDDNKILTKKGQLLSEPQFNALYGGYTFILDSKQSKVTRKAWEAFTQSSDFEPAKVDCRVFRPRSEERIVELEGDRLGVNTYVALNLKRKKGDAGPFIRHLQKLCATLRDQKILTSYLAYQVQQPWKKIPWCLVLQGVQGNGKTYICQAMMHVLGLRDSYSPKASELLSKFNSALVNKRFLVVDDIDLSSNRILMEILKPMISNTFMEIEGKGKDKYMSDIYYNMILTTNLKEGIPASVNERRFAHIYTAQQDVISLLKSGMHAAYFHDLFDWTFNQDGIEIIRDYLMTYKIPDEFNPDVLATRAPETSSTTEALEASKTDLEVSVLNLIEEGHLGLRGGFVSFKMLTQALQDKRIYTTDKMIGKVLDRLGYVKHPRLRDGRLTKIVAPDNVKSRIFVKVDHTSINANSSCEVVKLYTDAQLEK